MGKTNKEEEFLTGHLYRIEPFPFFDGGKRKHKYMIPLNNSSDGHLSYILLTTTNRFPAQKKLVFGEMKYSDSGPFGVMKPAFVLPKGTSVTRHWDTKLDSFIYLSCIHTDGPGNLKRLLSEPTSIIDNGAVHKGLFEKLTAFSAMAMPNCQVEQEQLYKQHGIRTGADGRNHISKYEKQSLLSIGISEEDIARLEIIGTIETCVFYPYPYRGYGNKPEPINKNLRFFIKKDGVYVSDKTGHMEELAIRAIEQSGRLLSFCYLAGDDRPNKHTIDFSAPEKNVSQNGIA